MGLTDSKDNNKIRIAGFQKESITDGLGVRYVIFTQGCIHHCDGCHNKETHSLDGGQLIDIEDILNEVKDMDYLKGITLSGGDPMLQPEAILTLVRRVKEETNFDIWCYTGYKFEELLKSNNRSILELLKYIDILVDGKYEKGSRSLSSRFRGSKNQRIIDVRKSLNGKEIKVINMD